MPISKPIKCSKQPMMLCNLQSVSVMEHWYLVMLTVSCLYGHGQTIWRAVCSIRGAVIPGKTLPITVHEKYSIPTLHQGYCKNNNIINVYKSSVLYMMAWIYEVELVQSRLRCYPFTQARNNHGHCRCTRPCIYSVHAMKRGERGGWDWETALQIQFTQT